MCGICGCVGKNNVIFDVLMGLKTLEYRGYDSSGIAFLKDGEIETIKAVGQIKNLEKFVPQNLESCVAISHTRWATHGKVSVENSHPHISQGRSVAIVHNGIIENCAELKKNMNDVSFYSETDTEIFANLIEKENGSPLEKMISASKKVRGSFAIAAIFCKQNKIFCAKRKSPLFVGVNCEKVMAASDICAFKNNFDYYYVIEDNEFAVLTENSVEFFDENGRKMVKNKHFFENFDFYEEISDGKCYMEKEIFQQPVVLKRTFYNFYHQKTIPDEALAEIKKFRAFKFIACGTAYHSCLMAEEFFRRILKKNCSSCIASEFRYGTYTISKDCLYVFVSQSGETADTLACARKVKNEGGKILCVSNVPYSSLNMLADFLMPTFAGREMAVASTKAYTAQVFSMLLLALCLGGKNYEEEIKKFVLQVEIEPLDEKLLNDIMHFEKIFFIGRNVDYVTSLEGALKLKEIAYINCLAVPAGELKHGTLALVDKNSLIVVSSTREELKEKVENSIQEIRARGGKILLLSQFHHDVECEYFIKLPKFLSCLMPLVNIFPLQQLALHFCQKRGFDPDKPRNLAKSVTVE